MQDEEKDQPKQTAQEAEIIEKKRLGFFTFSDLLPVPTAK